jgi:hypothetical protein
MNAGLITRNWAGGSRIHIPMADGGFAICHPNHSILPVTGYFATDY